jgi:MFS transporter, ACS family, glucarate transporter
LTPWIAAQLGWNAAFVAAAAVAVVGAAAWVCVNPERPLVGERAALRPAQPGPAV